MLARPAPQDARALASSLVFVDETVDGVLLPRVSDHKGVATIFDSRCDWLDATVD